MLGVWNLSLIYFGAYSISWDLLPEMEQIGGQRWKILFSFLEYEIFNQKRLGFLGR